MPAFSRIVFSICLTVLVCASQAWAVPARTAPKLAPALTTSRDSQTKESAASSAPLDLATTASAAKLPIIAGTGKQRKIVVRRAAVLQSMPRPATPSKPTMPLSAFLRQRLGSKYHSRSEWAGRTVSYLPKLRSWRVWRPIGRVEYLTIHHAADVPDEHPAAMIRNIFRGHTSASDRLDAPDVGYHFFVDRRGNVWEGRDANKLGTHVGSTPDGLNNEGNIGICGLGMFLRESPPKAMSAATVDLCALLSEYYGRPLTVRGHKDWLGINRFHPYGGVDCPGRLEAAVRQARQTIAKRFGAQKRLAQSIRQ